jgi:membrane-bound ClpP family serine protease
MKISKIIESTIQLGLILGLVGIVMILADALFPGSGIISILKICFLIAEITIPIYLVKKILDFYSNSYKPRFLYYLFIFLTTNILLFAFEQTFYNYFFPEYKAIYAEKKTQNSRDKMEEVEAKNKLKIENKESSLYIKYEETIRSFNSTEITKKYVNSGITYLLLSLVLSGFNRKSSEK